MWGKYLFLPWLLPHFLYTVYIYIMKLSLFSLLSLMRTESAWFCHSPREYGGWLMNQGARGAVIDFWESLKMQVSLGMRSLILMFTGVFTRLLMWFHYTHFIWLVHSWHKSIFSCASIQIYRIWLVITYIVLFFYYSFTIRYYYYITIHIFFILFIVCFFSPEVYCDSSFFPLWGQ